MSDSLDERSVRLRKLSELRELGVKLYPDKFEGKQDVACIKAPFCKGGAEHQRGGGFNIENPQPRLWRDSSFKKEPTLRSIEEIVKNPKNDIHTAGRVMLIRSFGKLIFGTLQDFSGQIQFALSKEFCLLNQDGEETGPTLALPEGEGLAPFKIFEKYIDSGDIIGIHGELFMTHKGELTIFVRSFQLLSKAIEPLGDKFHGIGEDNQETAYRKRYLDMIFNEDTRKRMKFRSDFIRTLREFYWSHGFLEIDCPVLTLAASGAAAKPFKTHHNDFDCDYYLRICNETELKKATVGGFEKVFTIAPDFRNEGSDPSHLQEFYMLEHQQVYKNFHEDMDFTQIMFDHIFDTLQLSRQFSVKDKEGNSKMVDFTTPWPRIDYVEGVKRASGLDITSYSMDDADRLRADIRAKGIEFEGMNQMGTMTLIDYLYKKVLRPTITGPAFVYNYPSIIAPLARISDSDPNKCEKWQVIVNGWEIINSYGELVDPQRQMANFEEQSRAENKGDAEATSADMAFVHAMEYGMPIQAGFGMGLERVMALLTQQDNLRDVVMFPMVKEKSEIRDTKIGKKDEEISNNACIILINEEANLPEWKILNTVGHLSASYGARQGKSIFYADDVKTTDGQKVEMCTHNPIILKSIPNSSEIRSVIDLARSQGLSVVQFTREMLEIANDNKVFITVSGQSFQDLEYYGVTVYGDTKKVKELTKGFPLFGTEAKKTIEVLQNGKESHDSFSIDLPKLESILDSYATTSREHNLAVGRCMRYFAQKLSMNAEYWYAVGILHDVDWDLVEKDMDKHCGDSLEKILQEAQAPLQMLGDIRSHYIGKYPEHELDSLLRKYLASIDELSGFIWACSRVTPGKTLDEVKVSSVIKRLKEKSFAAGISREHCRLCDELLGIPLEEFIPEVIVGMKR